MAEEHSEEVKVWRDRIAEAREQRERFEKTWLANLEHAATGPAADEGDETEDGAEEEL